MGWMCSSIIVCAFFRGVCALARMVNIEVVSGILWHSVADIQQSHRGFVCAFSEFCSRCGCALELLAGRIFVDNILHQFCQMLLVEFIGQKACWTRVRFRRLISLTGWDRCNSIVHCPYDAEGSNVRSTGTSWYQLVLTSMHVPVAAEHKPDLIEGCWSFHHSNSLPIHCWFMTKIYEKLQGFLTRTSADLSPTRDNCLSLPKQVSCQAHVDSSRLQACWSF